MSRANNILIYIFIAILILFTLGLYQLFSLRFRIGDIYPAYSSLRSDPLGTKVFFKSLSSLGDYDVQRNYQLISKLKGDRNTTLFILGATIERIEMANPNLYQVVSGIAASGGRLVISLYPLQTVNEPEFKTDKEDREHEKSPEGIESNKQDKGNGKSKKESKFILEQWGLGIARTKNQGITSANLDIKAENKDLPLSIKFPSPLYFTELDGSWDVIYTQKDLPVIIEKQFGAGSIVLYAGAYIFSNEAMMSERYPGLLSWFVGQGRKIYFDESHFGIRKTMGIIDLAYKYNLHGVVLVLLLIAGLFIWKNATHFIPPYDENEKSGVRSERDHLDGLVGLLQQNIPPKDLLKVCVREWEIIIMRDKGYLKPDITKIRGAIDTTDTQMDPVQTYNFICDKISERNRL